MALLEEIERVKQVQRHVLAKEIYVGLSVGRIAKINVGSGSIYAELRILAATSFKAADVFIEESQKQEEL